MKKILEIHFKSEEQTKKDVLRSIKTRDKNIQPKHHIYFASIEDFRGFMTVQKLELLTLIACEKPTSIYELAKLVHRDFSTVQKDCKGLKAAGFITLFLKKNGGRQSKAPQLKFNYSVIAVFLPKASYQIEFKDAA